jgi:hypothetical protein
MIEFLATFHDHINQLLRHPFPIASLDKNQKSMLDAIVRSYVGGDEVKRRLMLRDQGTISLEFIPLLVVFEASHGLPLEGVFEVSSFPPSWPGEETFPPAIRGLSIRGTSEPRPSWIDLQRSNALWTLEEIAELLRSRSGMECYVDRRVANQTIVVSNGRYQPLVLLSLLAEASDLEVRSLKSMWFLAPSRTPSPFRLSASVYLELYPPKVLETFRAMFSDLERFVDLRDKGCPFTTKAFLTAQRLAFERLTPDQKDFIGRLFLGVQREESQIFDREGWTFDFLLRNLQVQLFPRFRLRLDIRQGPSGSPAAALRSILMVFP